MPEGDVLHRTAARLQVLVGERVDAETPHPRAAATGIAAAIDGKVLESVEAVGKNLLLRFEGGVTLRSHLRMSGRWRVEPRSAPRTGKPWLVLRGTQWEAVQWNGPVLALDPNVAGRLGPDILGRGVTVETLATRIRQADQRRLLGDAVLDQRVVSGIGNIWMNESLWQARLSPWLPTAQARDEELELALDWAQRMMRASVQGARLLHSVYRRAGRPCPRCGATILSRGLGDANRTAYWCGRCQRGPQPADTTR
jgi:endonuclease VIII